MFNGPGRLVFERTLRRDLSGRGRVADRLHVARYSSGADRRGRVRGGSGRYARRATATAATGRNSGACWLSGGRKFAVNNEPRPTGGWVSTHEDIAERLQVEEEVPPSAIKNSAAPYEFRRRRVRPQWKISLAASAAMPAQYAHRLIALDNSQRTSERAASAVRSFDKNSANVKIVAAAAEELSRSIAEISNQLVQMSEVVQASDYRGAGDQPRDRRAFRRRAEDRRGRQAFSPSPNRLICWHLMPPSRQRARATPAAALPWSRPR